MGRELALLQETFSVGMNDLDHAKRFFVEGLAYLETQDFGAAESRFFETLKLAPRSVPTLNNLAIAQQRQNKIDDAILATKKAIEIDPNNVDAHFMLATCQHQQELYVEALNTCEKIISINPTFADAHCNRGFILNKLHKHEDALVSFDRALAIEPQLSDAHLNRGNALKNLKRYDEALDAFDKALAINPDLDGAWLGRGNVFFDLKSYDQALASYKKALAINSHLEGLEGKRLHTKMFICDWANFEADSANIIFKVRNKETKIIPFDFVALSSSPEDQLECAKVWIAAKHPASQNPIWRGELYKHDKIRIAYVSADFREHVTSILIAGMFENHDRSRFEVTAISIGPDDQSEMRKRLKGVFDHFFDAASSSDQEISSLIRERETDILVDLMGFTTYARTNIFAQRAAPIQLSYLGYPGTMGADYIDYLIADRTLIPESQKRFYTEKIVYLPDTYQVNEEKRSISHKVITRSEFGLPDGGFVFCCFNNNYKILPNVFDCWMRILKKVESSVLWLLVDNVTAASNLRKEAVARGVKSDRLIFAMRMSMPEHLARHRLADLFLDTLPYNAHTTASDALWAGLPVLTQIGETFAGRVAASLLHAAGLTDLIASTQQEYEELAIEFATNPAKLVTIRQKLLENRLTNPLFNTQLFTRHIERAYEVMYARYQAGLPPEDVVVPQ